MIPRLFQILGLKPRFKPRALWNSGCACFLASVLLKCGPESVPLSLVDKPRVLVAQVVVPQSQSDLVNCAQVPLGHCQQQPLYPDQNPLLYAVVAAPPGAGEPVGWSHRVLRYAPKFQGGSQASSPYVQFVDYLRERLAQGSQGQDSRSLSRQTASQVGVSVAQDLSEVPEWAQNPTDPNAPLNVWVRAFRLNMPSWQSIQQGLSPQGEPTASESPAPVAQYEWAYTVTLSNAAADRGRLAWNFTPRASQWAEVKTALGTAASQSGLTAQEFDEAYQALLAQSKTNTPPALDHIGVGTPAHNTVDLELILASSDPDAGASMRVQWYSSSGEFLNPYALRTRLKVKGPGRVDVLGVVRDLQGGVSFLQEKILFPE